MKLLSITHDDQQYTYYDINSIVKFNTIKDQLANALEKSLETNPLINQDVNDHLNLFKHQLAIKSKKFKLLIILQNSIIVSFVSAFTTQESGENVLLIYAAYFKSGLFNIVIEDLLRFFDVFAVVNECKRMSFLTARDPKIFERLLKKHKFRPTRTVFEREVINNGYAD